MGQQLRHSIQLTPVDLALVTIFLLQPIIGSLEVPIAQESFAGAKRGGVLVQIG